MKNKKLTVSEKQIRIQEQRFAMIITLCNVLDSESGVEFKIKSAICASLINIMQTSFIPGDDDELMNLIDNSINSFCKEIEEEKGIENYREELNNQVKIAKSIVDALNKKIERIKQGEEILKNICLN